MNEKVMIGWTEMIKCDGVIFDVDGTLWDSTDVVKDAWNEAIMKAGYPHPNITATRLKGLFGLPMDDIIKDIMPELSSEGRQKIEPLVYKYEHEFLEQRPGELYPKIIEVMREISRKIPVYIISNCQAGYVELFMKTWNIEDIIVDHLCPADTGMLKAENIMALTKKYDMKSPIYVGDTIMDQNACIKAKCPFCYAAYGFGIAKDPEYTIQEPEGLIKLLEI